jgi:hypothetical protein
MKGLRIYSSLTVLIAITAGGCATHTGTGAGLGGLLGAGTGALIGSQTGDAGSGAVLGAGLGALSGGLIGAGLDENDRRNEARVAAATAQPAPPPMSVTDVVQMAHSGVNDNLIIGQIQTTNSAFHLQAGDITALSQQGVSDRVIQAMMDTSRRPAFRARPVVYERPVVYHPAPVYVMEPPPPPVRIGVGFTHVHPRRCW